MQRLSLHHARAVGSCFVAIACVSILVVACSDKARLPSNTDNQRTYVANCTEDPPRPGGDTFAELYVDIFSLNGVAKCQSPQCHGNNVGQNGLVMYPAKLPATTNPPRAGIPDKPDDRGLWCGITTHLKSYTAKAVVCRDEAGVDCSCRLGDDCKCGKGVHEDEHCCNPKDAKDTTCDKDPTNCNDYCRKLVVRSDPGVDTTDYSDLIVVLSPGKDGEPAYMPNPIPCNNRKLAQVELERIRSWLKRGAPYDGDTFQPPYDCPPPTKAR